MRIGFLINPIAGMGGRVGLKGTDDVVDKAIRLGAEPVAPARAVRTLRLLHRRLSGHARRPEIEWLTCSGPMGEGALIENGFEQITIAHQTGNPPAASDTAEATRAFVNAGAELILFCGGDGTARDIAGITGARVPIVGIPAGVKMYSGVFGMSCARTAEIVARFIEGDLTPVKVDIVDLDEEKYRHGEWAVRLFCSATTPYEPHYTQATKAMISEDADAAVKAGIAEYVEEAITADPGRLFFLGPGSSVQAVAERFGVKKTLLGVDALLGGKIIARDLNEKGMLELLGSHPKSGLILSPIGAQGFVLGRGNLQISPPVMRRIGLEQVMVIATPAKLRRTPFLSFDTGDRALDDAFAARGYLPVITGYRRRRMVPIRI